MNYHSELPARVRQANADELLRLRRLYPRNARVQVLVQDERARRQDRPTPAHPFTYLPNGHS